ncbi:LysR family transcriptional regulator [Desulfosporosinus sp.]|uniref:LysR family transcriptional regulator n=1 Tax=Desulfosporosinus sp. TaxID=157907 RepID=UPI0025BBF4FB|nr:LysR family transcriptional regulator [Desulfosporosinus sp.]MBC2721714.1 LysR family transcriptional regulator [Desulfosporosinus sp.]MBC2726324.1 LysR family transcriptional regulator [Desulfosporosinus sp.]
MRIEHLYYLVEIAKTKSITLSAEHLFISQQGLSQAIQKLEADLNVPLLRRSRQGVSLTEAGNMAVEKAKEVILKYEGLLESMEPYSSIDSSNSSKKISIGATNFMSNYLPPILDLFRKNHPEVSIHIEEQTSDEIATKLSEGSLDIGLVNLPDHYDYQRLETSNIHFEKISSHEFLACVAKSSPLGRKIMLKKSEIKSHPIVAYNLKPYLDILSHMFGDLNQLNIIVKTNSREIFLKSMVHSKAIGIITLTDFNLYREKSIVPIPIKDSPSIDFGWLVSTYQPLSSAGQDLLEIYKNYMTSKSPF